MKIRHPMTPRHPVPARGLWVIWPRPWVWYQKLFLFWCFFWFSFHPLGWPNMLATEPNFPHFPTSAFSPRFRMTHSSTCGQSHLRYTPTCALRSSAITSCASLRAIASSAFSCVCHVSRTTHWVRDTECCFSKIRVLAAYLCALLRRAPSPVFVTCQRRLVEFVTQNAASWWFDYELRIFARYRVERLLLCMAHVNDDSLSSWHRMLRRKDSITSCASLRALASSAFSCVTMSVESAQKCATSTRIISTKRSMSRTQRVVVDMWHTQEKALDARALKDLFTSCASLRTLASSAFSCVCHVWMGMWKNRQDVTSRRNESCHTWMSHVTHECQYTYRIYDIFI